MRARLLQLLRCSRAAKATGWDAGGRGLAPSPTARIIPRALFFLWTGDICRALRDGLGFSGKSSVTFNVRIAVYCYYN